MARKKFYTETAEETEHTKSSDYKVGLYIRISREDGDKIESDSVVNQRNLLINYVNENPDMVVGDTYVDDGYTGTNFNRPSFLRMIEDIKSGKINCVIVKDLSRFGRDYIQAGSYLEQLFPFLNCRFISILDNLDSLKNPDDMTGIFTRFKHIMNDYYSAEISKKIRRTFDAQRREGKLVSTFAPYGYKKDPEDVHHLVIDIYSSQVVRQIYDWHLKGMGVIRIAKKLNSLKILTPTQYRKEKNIQVITKTSNKYGWIPSTVRGILSNKVYRGALEQKKKTSLDHKNRKVIYLKDKDRILVEDTHEPIISEKIFNQVQRNFDKCTRTSPNKEKLYVFSGFLRCADCNRAMIRASKRTQNKLYVYYKCRTYNQVSKEKCSKSHSIRHELLEDIVRKAIKLQIHTVANMLDVLKKVKEEYRPKTNIDFKKETKNRHRQIDSKRNLKIGLYEDFKKELLTKSEYINLKNKYDADINELEESIFKLKQEENEAYNLEKSNFEWMEQFAQKQEIKELTRELLTSLVDMIYINANKGVTIKFKYQDEFNTASELLSKRVEVGK